MAENRYFKVLKDVSLPRAFRAVRDNSGTTYDYETEGRAYNAGEYVHTSHVDPRVVERFDDGDEHLNSLLEEASEEDAKQYAEDLRSANQLVRLPEHSVEAYVLASDPEEPYTLLNVEEGLELASAGAEDAKKALEEVKEDVDDKLTEEDEREAIDFAAAKGKVDVKADRAKSVREFVEGEKEDGGSKKSKKVDVEKAAAEGKVSPSNATQADKQEEMQRKGK